MTFAKLTSLLEEIQEKTSIEDADVFEIRRTILPDGILYRDEAEFLVAMECSADRRCAAWNDLFVEFMVDYLVWGERPTGRITTQDADWLFERLAPQGRPCSANARSLMVALVRETENVDPRLVATAFACQAPIYALATGAFDRTGARA